MKALVKNIHGISIKEMEIPAPSNSTDILVHVSHVGLCRTDLQVANGNIAISMEEVILGHEFSAEVVKDPLGILEKGQWIGFNPLVEQKFMGLDFNGAIVEYLWIKRDNVIPTQSIDPKLIAYLEPVAASMAVLKAIDSEKCMAIVGNNRIASLTHKIITSLGYNCDLLDENKLENIPDNSYDMVIESVFDATTISHIIRILKTEGKIIIKSRKKQPVHIIASDLVAKEITAQAVNYYSFSEAMSWLEKNSNLVNHLLGQDFPLSQWEEAFMIANKGEGQKIFINLRKN